MKIAILHGPRDLRIEDHESPDPSKLAADQVWVQTEISALKIGTDRGNYEGAEHVPGAPLYPRQVGDSNLGVVGAVGSDVSRFRVGDRVVSRMWHQSEYVTGESEWSLVKVPPGVDSADAVYSHLYALSAHCYRKAQFVPGEFVAVVGVGVLGLGAIALGPLFGARVVGIANSPQRIDMARTMGAHECFLSSDADLSQKLDEFTNGAGIDLVILAANPWPAYRTAMEIVRMNGRVATVGLQGRGEPDLDFNPLAMELFYAKAVSLIAVNGAAGDMYPAADGYRFDAERSCNHMLSLMEEGKLKPSKLITHRLKYTEMVDAYEMIFRREKGMMGVLFEWDQ